MYFSLPHSSYFSKKLQTIILKQQQVTFPRNMDVLLLFDFVKFLLFILLKSVHVYRIKTTKLYIPLLTHIKVENKPPYGLRTAYFRLYFDFKLFIIWHSERNTIIYIVIVPTFLSLILLFLTIPARYLNEASSI
jgi:hypothetical protein